VKRTTLAKKGTSETALIEDEIQDLLREGAIKRDGRCILCHSPEAGNCGGYRNDGELQAFIADKKPYRMTLYDWQKIAMGLRAEIDAL
jgi:hypothetical protein